jgi:branched-chain amino acid transport system permease protein
MTLGAYFIYLTLVSLSLPLILAVVGACLLSGILGIALYALFIRPMTTQPILAIIIVTMGISIFLGGAASVVWGAQDLFLTTTFVGVQDFHGFPISNYSLIVISTSAVACGALIAFFRFSRIGLQMRATAENAVLASQRGISLTRIMSITWLLAGLTAGLAGMLYAGNTAVSPSISDLGLRAFPAALVGGFDSVGGTLVGALIVASAETYAALTWGPEARTAAPFAILLVIMMIRPRGLFGKPESIGRA